MKAELLDIICCPVSGEALLLEDAEYRDGGICTGWLVSKNGEYRYPVRDYIPRFVPESNYADNFGMQWNHFSKTQLDSHSGHSISADRFWKATGWRPEDVNDQWVLDVGCGAGRFAEIALLAGAKVVALDYSSAVDACYENLKHYSNLHVVQGDIYSLPFLKNFSPFVYSLGVLQHTPDVAKAFFSLPPMVEKGGALCVDFYQKSWKSALLPKYWLRPLTKRLPKAQLFEILQAMVPKMLTLSQLLGRVPVLGSGLKRLIPVANYFDILPLSEKQHIEWALLDTFDWFSPEFDNPQKPETVRRWLESAGVEQVEVLNAGHLVGRGTIPDAPRN